MKVPLLWGLFMDWVVDLGLDFVCVLGWRTMIYPGGRTKLPGLFQATAMSMIHGTLLSAACSGDVQERFEGTWGGGAHCARPAETTSQILRTLLNTHTHTHSPN